MGMKIFRIILLSFLVVLPTIASSDTNGSVSDNSWYVVAPNQTTSNLSSFTSGRIVDRVQRGKTAFFLFTIINTSEEATIQQSADVPTKVACTIGGDETNGCASAPLFIASQSATICVNSDLASNNNPSAAEITVYTCMDSTCNRNQAVDVRGSPILATTDNYGCFEANGTGGSIDVVSSGGSWIYVVLSSAMDGSDGQTALVSVTGK